jgi:hypothetical protein
MSEQNRILRAMASLDDFTVDELVRHCDASPSTVRTVLLRNPSRVEELGVTETGRPGGRWKRYRLLPERRQGIDADAPPEGEGDRQVPLDLIAAEEMLLSDASIDIDPRTRSSLLRRTQRRLRHAAGDPVANQSIAVAHAYVVRGLVALVEAEGKRDIAGLFEAEARVEKARRDLSADDKLLVDFDERIDLSPLQDLMAPEWRDRVTMSVAREAVLASMVGVVTKITQKVLYESPEVGRAVVPRAVSIGSYRVRAKVSDRGRTRKFSTVRVSRRDPDPAPSSVAWDTETGWLKESDEQVAHHG